MTSSRKAANQAFEIGDARIMPGTRATVDIPLASMYTHSTVSLTMHVVNGRQPGPVLFVCAAIHGDEINGVEIIRQLMLSKQLSRLRGTLVAIPVVNVHGFLNQQRYLPDGRDLNRSFPGSPSGSLAGRVAHTFLDDIVKRCTHGIDLHTAARHRANLPQIRADLSNGDCRDLAEAFGVPVIIDSKMRNGSLRENAAEAGIPVIVYEAGEALRFDEFSIRAGVRGIKNVLRSLGMLAKKSGGKAVEKLVVAEDTRWIRAPESGIVRPRVDLGARVVKDQVLASITDPLGVSETDVLSHDEGVVIGISRLPLIHEGEALMHLASYKKNTEQVADVVSTLQGELTSGDSSSVVDPVTVEE